LVPRVTRVLAGPDPLSLEGNSIVLIPWGDADWVSFEASLARIPRGVRIHCIQLSGGAEFAKSEFFREGVLVDAIDALPAGRPEARALLERLEIIEPPRNP